MFADRQVDAEAFIAFQAKIIDTGKSGIVKTKKRDKGGGGTMAQASVEARSTSGPASRLCRWA